MRLWDLPEEKEIRIFSSHTDYVRSAIVSPDNPSLLLSGSYDGTVKLWDARMAENDGCAINMRHGAPVEDVLIFPTGGGGVALSAGGPVLRAWDLMMAGRCTNAVSNHSKTITSLSLSMSSGAGATAAAGLGGIRVLSAGLDHLVKVYDPAKEYKVVHTMRYPAPILCLAVSPDESHIAAGMADGTLCIRKRQLRASELQHRQEQTQSYEYFVGAGGSQQPQSQSGTQQDEIRVESVRRQRLKPYDKLLKKFQHSDALDAVLRKEVPPSVTFALLAELRDRSSADGSLDGLRRAIEGRDDVTLEPLLRFLLRQSSNPSYTSLVSDCLNVIIGEPGSESSTRCPLLTGFLSRHLCTRPRPVAADRRTLWENLVQGDGRAQTPEEPRRGQGVSRDAHGQIGNGLAILLPCTTQQPFACTFTHNNCSQIEEFTCRYIDFLNKAKTKEE